MAKPSGTLLKGNTKQASDKLIGSSQIDKEGATSKSAPVRPTTSLKRLAAGSLQLQFAGSLVLVKISDKDSLGLFRRYEALFEHYANIQVVRRLISYKMICGLALTSHAKKTSDKLIKKQLFDRKNELFFDLANNRDLREHLEFRYLRSHQFRVSEFCDECRKRNEASKLSKHEWKFCKNCKLDRNFYNVLAMRYKEGEGSITLFLSHDLIAKLDDGLRVEKKGKLANFKEEAVIGRYHYNVRNLDAIALTSVVTWHERLLS